MKTNNWQFITMWILIGIVLGMLIMYFAVVFSFERLFESAQGIIQNINIDLNETEITDKLITFANQSGATQ